MTKKTESNPSTKRSLVRRRPTTVRRLNTGQASLQMLKWCGVSLTKVEVTATQTTINVFPVVRPDPWGEACKFLVGAAAVCALASALDA